MAMDSFGEALQRLKEVYEQDVEGWQEKVFGLTNQKTSDAKRIEELFSRNQHLREQQRSLTENIKQLENRLRAGLCDRCIVTQDMAKRRQQEYESTRLQSLQVFTSMAKEIAAMRKDNVRLSEEVKSMRNHNGCSTETASPEVKPLLAAVSPVALLSPSQKSTASPVGGTVQTSETGHSGLCMTNENRPVDGVSQQQGFELSKHNTPPLSQPSPLTAAWRTVQNIGRDPPAPERRTRSMEVSESSPFFPASMLLLKNNPYSSSPAAPEEKRGSSKVHAPIPCRPQPINTHNFPHSWLLPDNPDWVTMSVIAEGGTVIHHNPSMLPSPAINPSTHCQSTQERVRRAQKLWAQLSPAGKASGGPLQSLAEQVDGVRNSEEHVRSTAASASASASTSAAVSTCQSWKAAAAEDTVPREGTDNEAPLDLSESGRDKAIKTPPEAPVKTTPADSPFSSSSSSPPAPSSSSVESSGSQSELKLTWQDDPDEGVQAAEQSRKDKTIDLTTSPGNPKVPAFTISLRPVVVLENMKKRLSGQNSGDIWVTSQQKEYGEYEDEAKNEEQQSNQRKRIRREKESLQQTSLMVKRARTGGRLKDRSPGDTDQGCPLPTGVQ